MGGMNTVAVRSLKMANHRASDGINSRPVGFDSLPLDPLLEMGFRGNAGLGFAILASEARGSINFNFERKIMGWIVAGIICCNIGHPIWGVGMIVYGLLS